MHFYKTSSSNDKRKPDTPPTRNRPVQRVEIEESTRHKYVKTFSSLSAYYIMEIMAYEPLDKMSRSMFFFLLLVLFFCFVLMGFCLCFLCVCVCVFLLLFFFFFCFFVCFFVCLFFLISPQKKRCGYYSLEV